MQILEKFEMPLLSFEKRFIRLTSDEVIMGLFCQVWNLSLEDRVKSKETNLAELACSHRGGVFELDAALLVLVIGIV